MSASGRAEYRDGYEKGFREGRRMSATASLDVQTAFQIDAEVRRLQKEADAALAEAAGCTCRSLYLARERARYTCGFDGDYRYDGENFQVTRHDSRCPHALAAAIRSQP